MNANNTKLQKAQDILRSFNNLSIEASPPKSLDQMTADELHALIHKEHEHAKHAAQGNPSKVKLHISNYREAVTAWETKTGKTFKQEAHPNGSYARKQGFFPPSGRTHSDERTSSDESITPNPLFDLKDTVSHATIQHASK